MSGQNAGCTGERVRRDAGTTHFTEVRIVNTKLTKLLMNML
jgi:hypothetical protein